MKQFAGMLAVGLALLGLASPTPALGTAAHRAAAAAAASIHWGSCPTRLYPDLIDSGVKCAALKVPMDYQYPSGRTVTLEVSMLRHTSSARKYKGVILSNPGGPGGAGLDLPLFLAGDVPGSVGEDYDWVGWDPRGVGASKPTIRCQRSYFKAPRRSYIPSSTARLHYWLHRSKAYADSCERRYPNLLNNMTTIDSAKDMDSIRDALGVPTISYYGFSYGTYLGEVYSTLFPTHLKYLVLDSSVDPRRIWYQANLNQDRAFNRNIQIYFRWVAKYNSIYRLGSTQQAVAHRFDRDVAALTKHPAGRLGPDEWKDAFLSAGYDQSSWEELASAWRAYALHGNPSPMIQAYVERDQPGDDNLFAVYNAVQCTDTQWPTKWSRWRRDNNAANKKYPFLTWGNAWFNAPCLYWGAKAHKPVAVNGAATRSALLIDETRDAATPYSGSLEVRRLYPHSSLIAEPGGTTHADSLSGNPCVDDQIAAYLKTGHRPSRKHWNGPDALCRPFPVPDPADPGFAARPRAGH